MAVKLSGLMSNMDTDSIVESMMEAQNLKKTKVENKITKLEWKQEKWKDLNTKIYSFYTGSLSKLKLQSSYNVKKANSSNENAVNATAGSTAASGAHKLGIKQLASSKYVTGSQITPESDETLSNSSYMTDISSGLSGTTITIEQASGKKTDITMDDSTKISDFITSCKTAGINASFDARQGRFFFSSTASGAESDFSITASDDGVLESIGLDGKETIVPAQDAIFTLNDAEMTSTSNNITVNGITLELKEVTTSDMTISVVNDTDSVYNMIKGFVSDYNSLLEELNTSYHADTARSYSPLTDDEKASMSDEEVEKWEKKIKDSLLRRDDKVNSVISAMRNAMTQSVEIDEKVYSLSSFGITTSAYTEKGKLHIDGDADDATNSANQDKLRKALEENPDAVIAVLTKIGNSLYSDVQDKMKATTISSALTIYNDKEMTKTMTRYKKELSTLEEKLATIEERYYSQFSAMETALANLQSQSNALSSMISG